MMIKQINKLSRAHVLCVLTLLIPLFPSLTNACQLAGYSGIIRRLQFDKFELELFVYTRQKLSVPFNSGNDL